MGERPPDKKPEAIRALGDDPAWLVEFNRVVNSLKGFTSVKSSSAKQVHLSVLDDAEGSFVGEVAENVVLHYGKVYAPGLTLIVR